MRLFSILVTLSAAASCALPVSADATSTVGSASTRPAPVLPSRVQVAPTPAQAAPSRGAPPVALPSSPLVVRDCYGHSYEEGRSGYGAGGLGGAVSKSASVPQAAGAPAPVMRSSRTAQVGGVDSASAPAAPPQARAESAPSLDVVTDRAKTSEPSVQVATSHGPRVDWGGVVHLSNDDSMSLASAQRLLWALDRDAGFTVDQIRPHELLNYFTFDGTQPRPGDTFSLLASAERTEPDQLSLALSVTATTPPRAPLDLTVVVDRSGSMSAEGRIDYTRRALSLLTQQLHRGDRFDLVLFDDEVCTPVQDFVVGRDDASVLTRAIGDLQPRGSTDLDLGLREGYRLASSHAGDSGRAPRVMVFTDAILNTGDVDPNTVSEVGRAMQQHGVRLTGVGVGSDFRDDVLDLLTEKGHGAYVFLGSERVVDRLFGRGFDALVQTVAEDVRFALDLPPSLGMTKFYGEESSTRAEDVQPVSVHAGTRQVFLQDLAIRPGTLRNDDPIRLTVQWTDPVTGAQREQALATTVGEALATDPHTVRKARALIGWTDVLIAHALGQDACAAPLTDYRHRLGGLAGDAEVAYATELLGKWCDLSEPVVAWTEPARAATKIRLDADVPIDEVALSCGGDVQRAALTGSDTVARFDTHPGACLVTLFGTVPMTARVDVPSTGGDLRCVLRGGRLDCR